MENSLASLAFHRLGNVVRSMTAVLRGQALTSSVAWQSVPKRSRSNAHQQRSRWQRWMASFPSADLDKSALHCLIIVIRSFVWQA